MLKLFAHLRNGTRCTSFSSKILASQGRQTQDSQFTRLAFSFWQFLNLLLPPKSFLPGCSMQNLRWNGHPIAIWCWWVHPTPWHWTESFVFKLAVYLRLNKSAAKRKWCRAKVEKVICESAGWWGTLWWHLPRWLSRISKGLLPQNPWVSYPSLGWHILV